MTQDRRHQQTQLPKGAKIYLPDEAAQKRRVEAELLGVFRKWGYRDIVTSAYEYFDVVSQGTDQDLQERMFKMVDRESGRLLALRADVTPQIARIVATRLREAPKPLRLAYLTNVFRYDEPHVGRYREFYQAGVELVGLPNAEGDAEMIAMTVEGLGALGLTGFQIDVGQADFFRGILEDLGLEELRARELRSALARKDVSALERLVAGLGAPSTVTELLLALPTLYGRGDVLERAERLVKNPRSEAALANLAEIYRLLRVYGLADAVLLDLGEATGFAFEVGRALLAMESQGVAVLSPGPDFFIIDFTTDKTGALELSRRLRDAGAAVARDILSRPVEESLAYARQQRAGRALVIGEPGAPAGQVRVVSLEGSGEGWVSIAEILADPARHFPGVGGAHHA